jgi:hypothetical protein
MTVNELMARVAEAVKDDDAARAQAKVLAIVDEGYAALEAEKANASTRGDQVRVPDLLS